MGSNHELIGEIHYNYDVDDQQTDRPIDNSTTDR